MKSEVKSIGYLNLPLIEGEISMIPFNSRTLTGLTGELKDVAKKMLHKIPNLKGTAYFTIHGKKLKKGETLRRPGAHIDGNYEPHLMDFGGGGGWKTGDDGRPVGHPIHERQFAKETGGIVLVSNYHACNGWVGDYQGIPEKGGDCTHFDLDEPFQLMENTIYYGNNHFIHESLPMADDVHRVFARVTLPEEHLYSAR